MLEIGLALFAAILVYIMPLGDSITNESTRDPALDKPVENLSSYRDDLWYALQSGGYDVNFVGSLQSGQDVVPAFEVSDSFDPLYRKI